MIKLRKYQRIGVRTLNRFKGRALLADEMGLGKTIQALEWINQKPKERGPALVVCPASLKFVWEHEATTHYNMKTTVLSGRSAPTRRGLFKPKGLYIINYDILDAWEDFLCKYIKPKTVIADECHYLTNPETIRTCTVKRMSEEARYFIGLSGTPLTNSPDNLFPILNMIRPDLYSNHQTFVWEYTHPQMRPWGWDYKKPKNLDDLHAALKDRLMIRRLKKDVLKELPPITRSVVPIEITNRREYDKAERDFLSYIKQKAPHRYKKAKRAPALCKANELRMLAAQGKIKGIINWVDSWLEETDEKILLFGYHQDVIDAIYQHYKKIAVQIVGKTSQKMRKNAVQQLQKNPKCRLLIGNIKAAGVGLTLTASRIAAFIELSWVPDQHTQAESRPHRIGQKGNVEIYYLLARQTIDERMFDILNSKQQTASSALDGKRCHIFRDLIKEFYQNG